MFVQRQGREHLYKPQHLSHSDDSRQEDFLAIFLTFHKNSQNCDLWKWVLCMAWCKVCLFLEPLLNTCNMCITSLPCICWPWCNLFCRRLHKNGILADLLNLTMGYCYCKESITLFVYSPFWLCSRRWERVKLTWCFNQGGLVIVVSLLSNVSSGSVSLATHLLQ